MTDREFLQQMYTLLQTEPRATVACDQLESMLAERLARCDTCGKPLGEPGHIHTCSPQRLAQPKQPQWHMAGFSTPPRREWVGLTEQEPKLSCGVDYDDGLLTVSVVHGHADGSMEVIHCEQIATPIKAQPEPDNDFQERLARAIEAMPFGDTARSFATFVREFK